MSELVSQLDLSRWNGRPPRVAKFSPPPFVANARPPQMAPYCEHHDSPVSQATVRKLHTYPRTNYLSVDAKDCGKITRPHSVLVAETPRSKRVHTTIFGYMARSAANPGRHKLSAVAFASLQIPPYDPGPSSLGFLGPCEQPNRSTRTETDIGTYPEPWSVRHCFVQEVYSAG